MKLRATAGAWLCCVAALMATAQETDAPLSQTKQQLQSLRKDQTAEKTDTGEKGFRAALPGLQPHSPLQPALELPSRPDAAREKKAKADARKNWLLDGYDKLDRQGRVKRGDALRRDEIDTDETEEILDPADPDYFLRVYERQRAVTENRQAETRSTETKMTGATNAFAPFLQDWLAGSPVRDALKDVLDSANRGGSTPNAPVVMEDRRGASVASDIAIGAGSPSHTAQPQRGATANPFVQALGLPADARTNDVRPLAPVFAPPPANASNPATTLPALVPEESRRQGPPPTDDKKYFPQLKKF